MVGVYGGYAGCFTLCMYDVGRALVNADWPMKLAVFSKSRHLVDFLRT